MTQLKGGEALLTQLLVALVAGGGGAWSEAYARGSDHPRLVDDEVNVLVADQGMSTTWRGSEASSGCTP